MNMHSSQKNLMITMRNECIMGSTFLLGIPWPKKLTVFNLNEKRINIFVFVFFLHVTWKSAVNYHFLAQRAVGNQFPEKWLIHFTVVCVTKAARPGI